VQADVERVIDGGLVLGELSGQCVIDRVLDLLELVDEAAGSVGNPVHALVDSLDRVDTEHEVSLLLLLLAVFDDLPDELLEGVFIRLNDFVVPPQVLLQWKLVVKRYKAAAILLLEVHADVMRQQVGWVVVLVGLLHRVEGEFALLTSQGRRVVVSQRIKVLKVDSVDFNRADAIVHIHISGDDRQMMKGWVTNLVDDAVLVITILRRLLRNVNVVHENFDTYAQINILADLKLARVLRADDIVHVSSLDHVLQSVVLLCDQVLIR
jgi:hypothetical protein